MGHAKGNTFVGIVFLAAWISFLILIKSLKTYIFFEPAYFQEIIQITLLYLNIPVFFIWLLLGYGFGVMSAFVSFVFIALVFKDKAYIFPLVSFVATGFVAHKIRETLQGETKHSEVDIERSAEEINLLSDEVESEKNNNLRMRDSLKRIAHLKNIVEDCSQTLSEEDALNFIVKDSFGLFEGAGRVLLYLVDVEKQELKLACSKRESQGLPVVKAKKGDVLDRWVLKHGMPLLIEDIHNDFRFSLKKERDERFKSMISTPLTTEHKILGVLRIDSARRANFTQSDLRLLDIIADLSSVSLQNAILYKKVQNLAIHDSLTGLYVHKYFVERLQDEIKRSLRNDSNLSLLMLDLDDFKAYNDKYGHNAGDLVLKHVSSILKGFVSSGDILCRYGGEEFVLLLLNKAKSDAAKIAEDIREKISQTPLILRRKETKITVSIGVASCPSDKKETETLLMLVDSRLYGAKKKGKNRVCLK